MPSVTIDLNNINQAIISPNNLSEAQKLYLDLDYLNTNSRIDALAKLRKELADDPNRLSQKEREGYADELFAALENYAQRTKIEAIKSAYQAYLAHPNDKQKKKDFINSVHGNLEMNSNQVEIVVAKTLEKLLDNNSSNQEVARCLEESMHEYELVCQKQATLDFHRIHFVYEDKDQIHHLGEQARVATAANPTGEQLGFIDTMFDQGKFCGGYTIPLMHIAANLGLNALPDNTSSKSYLYKKDGRLYLMRSDKLIIRDHDDPATVRDFVTTHMIVDITDLKGNSFSPGCASKKPEIRLVVEGDHDAIGELDIPGSIVSRNSEIDPEIILFSRTVNAREQIINILADNRQLNEPATHKMAEIVLAELEQAMKGAGIGDKDGRERAAEQVAAVLSPLEEKFGKEKIKDFAKHVVQDYAYETDRMNLIQKIKHKLKEIFLKDKYEAIHNDAKEFATEIKKSIRKRERSNEPVLQSTSQHNEIDR